MYDLDGRSFYTEKGLDPDFPNVEYQARCLKRCKEESMEMYREQMEWYDTEKAKWISFEKEWRAAGKGPPPFWGWTQTTNKEGK